MIIYFHKPDNYASFSSNTTKSKIVVFSTENDLFVCYYAMAVNGTPLVVGVTTNQYYLSLDMDIEATNEQLETLH